MEEKTHWKKTVILFVLSCFMLLMVGVLFFGVGKFLVSDVGEPALAEDNTQYTVVIDAGHGGIDGGATVNGIFEKDINLSVSKKVKEFLHLYDVNVVLTRNTDTLLCDENSKHKKRDDLYNRMKVAKSVNTPIFLSIHMNKFSEEKYKGLQVFFSPNNNDSEALSLLIQQNVREYLQSDNDRQAKKATSSIYLLDRLTCPAVIVECGFLSNSEDLKNLTDEKYQNVLAFVIANSIIEFINI